MKNDFFLEVFRKIGLNFYRAFYGKKVKKGFWYVPYEPSAFVEQLEKVKENFSGEVVPSFLDVGCGVGLTLLLAWQVGFKPYGIEIVPELVKLAKLFTYSLGGWVKRRDALKFKDYDKFDVIYFYCPIKDMKLENRLERLIEDKMRVGAFLIANCKQNNCIEKDNRFKKIYENNRGDAVWIKVKG